MIAMVDQLRPSAVEEAKQIGEDYQQQYGWKDTVEYETMLKGLTEETVKEIARVRDEPAWLEQFRLRALKHFYERPMPTWISGDLSGIRFEDYYYYSKPKVKENAADWTDLPPQIRSTFQRLGIPENERKFLAGVGAVYESSEVFKRLRADLEEQGVVLTTISKAVKDYPDLVKAYLGHIVPFTDNKFAALNSAVFSDGSFIWVPKGVKIDKPIETYFRMNAKSSVQAERTLIIAEPDSEVSYAEGCTSPVYNTSSVHAAVVELVALARSKIKYFTFQSWDKSTYNMVTKRSHAYEDATITWTNLEIGSRVNAKYPSIYLLGKRAKGEIFSMAYAGRDVVQDTGGKLMFYASDTSGKIISKSVSKDNGLTVYRGMIRVDKRAENVKALSRCDALLLGPIARTATYPYNEIHNDSASLAHEASVNAVSEDAVHYIMSRGIPEQEALGMIVNGFVEPIVREVPEIYGIEFTRMLNLEMVGSVG